jgi:hypothetical protein
LPLWGSIVASDGASPWLLVDGVGGRVELVPVFLRDLTARGRSAGRDDLGLHANTALAQMN